MDLSCIDPQARVLTYCFKYKKQLSISNSNNRQRFPLKLTEIWSYRKHRFCVLKFPLGPLHSSRVIVGAHRYSAMPHHTQFVKLLIAHHLSLCRLSLSPSTHGLGKRTCNVSAHFGPHLPYKNRQFVKS